MHLVTPLAAGVSGAGNGTASIFARGTTTRARYYLDFEATQPIQTGEDVQLDANGGAEVYVNQLVDVVVKDSVGTTTRLFTAGDSAPNVEVISQSFTGTSYTSGQQGASLPTTLQAVLDSLKTSFGSTDFNVLANGASVSMLTLVSSVVGVIFNVKTYGALGNGTANDTSAVNAAVNAASLVGGGIVYFPPGTYRLTAAISSSPLVHYYGSGPRSSIVLMDSPAADTFTYALGSDPQIGQVRNLGFAQNQATSGNTLRVTGPGCSLLVSDCEFGKNTNGATALQVDAALTDVRVFWLRNDVQIRGTENGVHMQSGILFALFSRFNVRPSGAYNGLLLRSDSGGGCILGCHFDGSTAGSGNFWYILLSASHDYDPCVVAGCSFKGPGGTSNGTVSVTNGFDLGNRRDSASALVWSFQSSAGSTAWLQSTMHTGERDIRRVALSGAGAATTTLPDDAGEVVYTTTAAVDTAITGPSAVPGRKFTIIFDNNTGVNRGVTIVSGAYTVTGPGVAFTVNANSVSVVDCEFFYTTTGIRLVTAVRIANFGH